MNDAMLSSAVAMKYRWIPKLSTAWFGIVHPANSYSSSIILLSNDQLENIYTLSIPSIPTAALANIDLCSGSSATNPTIKDIVSYPNSFLSLTPGGLLVLNKTSSNALAWTNILSECLVSMIPKSQAPTYNSSQCNPTFIIGDTGRIWVYKDEFQNVFELLDSLNRNVEIALGLTSPTILSISASSTQCQAYQILLKSNSIFYIVKYHLNAWEFVFRFQTQVPLFTDTSGTTGMIRMFHVDNSFNNAFIGVSKSSWTWMNLDLTSFAFSQSISSDLFIWGNALLYSPDAGLNMFLIRSFTNSIVVTSLSSGSDGSFVFTTSDNQVWYGDLGANHLIPIKRAQTSITGSTQVLYNYIFNSRNTLLEWLVTVNQNTNSISSTTTAISLSEYASYSEYSNGIVCPISRIFFKCPKEVKKIRRFSVVLVSNRS